MYIVIELQQTASALQHIVSTHATLQEAESKFHTVLAAAAVSGVPVHSAVLLNGSGRLLKTESYRHTEEE